MIATRIFRPRNIVLAVVAAFGIFLAGFGHGAMPPDECIGPPHGPPPVDVPPPE